MLNPFNVSFGKKPLEMLSRSDVVDKIAEIFENDNPKTESFIITGPRGSGKTIALGLVNEYFESKKDWIVVSVNPYLEIHEQLAARIYADGKFKKMVLKGGFSFSFKGVGFSISGEEKVNDIFTLLGKMLSYLKKKNKKVLISIDDISNNENVRAFIYSFQSFLTQGYDVFFLGTGLYKNVASLQNNKSLTFLLRTPKIMIEPLNMRATYLAYKRLLSVSDETALELAKLSNGYAYGFQLLGSLMFESKKKAIDEEITYAFDIELENKVYSMIWEELTQNEKNIVSFIAENEKCTREEINKSLGLKGNSFSVYKKSLTYVGILDGFGKDNLKFYLPRFKEFVLFKNKITE